VLPGFLGSSKSKRLTHGFVLGFPVIPDLIVLFVATRYAQRLELHRRFPDNEL
jgi:hypothetical protein